MQVTLLMMAAQVISAFEVPKVQYDPVRKCFFKPTASLELLGIAQVRPETTQLVLGDEVETQQKVCCSSIACLAQHTGCCNGGMNPGRRLRTAGWTGQDGRVH